ncbi:MAG: peptidoglycan DD-metalloendopeptidase family protein, partial [Planctomycetes bacterium]|nr:peptidoglycan DD-metalloendopeptidase family protein [Planctomycetota bacterium]
LRQASIRETQLERELVAQDGEIAVLLTAIQSIETAPPPVLFAHPAGPLGSARAAMILADVTPALAERAGRLDTELDDVRALRTIQQNAVQRMTEGLAGIQSARVALNQALADRTDLRRRFTEDPVRTAILISSTETLAAFANGLSLVTSAEIPPVETDIADSKGALDLPVQGEILHHAGEADAAGITRDGILVSTRPRALVVSPATATIRYRGPLLDLGNVVILEPQAETLFVLSGLDQVYGETGQVIPAGSPVGMMGGDPLKFDTIQSITSDGTGTDLSETLYIEVRESGSPVDPETWFRTGRNG